MASIDGPAPDLDEVLDGEELDEDDAEGYRYSDWLDREDEMIRHGE